MRIKQLEYDGMKFNIAPLNLDQHEVYRKASIEYLAKLEKMSEAEKQESIFSQSLPIICDGLNNAIENGATKWDEARCRQELDTFLVGELRDQIIEFSRMSPSKKERENPGESKAAS